MPPKKSDELKAKIQAQQGKPAKEGHERTAEGEETRTPTRGEFFSNLEKLAKPKP